MNHPVDVAYAALLEVGRRDLAESILWFEDEDGGYLEVNDDILDEADWALVDRADAGSRIDGARAKGAGLTPENAKTPPPITGEPGRAGAWHTVGGGNGASCWTGTGIPAGPYRDV